MSGQMCQGEGVIKETCLSMEREARLINETLSIFVPHSHTNVHMHGG